MLASGFLKVRFGRSLEFFKHYKCGEHVTDMVALP